MIGSSYYMVSILRWLFWNKLRKIALMQRQSPPPWVAHDPLALLRSLGPPPMWKCGAFSRRSPLDQGNQVQAQGQKAPRNGSRNGDGTFVKANPRPPLLPTIPRASTA